MARSAPGKGHPGNAPGGTGPGAGRTGGGTKTGGTGNGASSLGDSVLDALRDALPDVTGPAPYGSGGKPSGQGAGGVGEQGGLKPAAAPQLPQIEDTPPAEPKPDQDLTPLKDAPKRKPIRSALGSFAGSVGITGQAGVFIP